MLRIVELYHLHSQPQHCDICALAGSEEEKPAIHKCVACGHKLCDDHAKVHAKKPAFASHQIVSLNDTDAVSTSTSSITSKKLNIN